MKYRVAVIDAGGRGAALVHKYSQNPDVEKIIAIPGNDFMQFTSSKPVETHTNLKTTSVEEIIEICKKENVSLVDVAQDNAVAVGLVDKLIKEGIPVFGPKKNSGEIEWNKAWAREFMKRHDLPQPEYQIFESTETAITFLQNQKEQKWFIKASGLCEGKGALPANDNAEAQERVIELQKFGEAAKVFLVEKWLQSKNGIAEEFSAFAISDGNTFEMIGYAQDHKRVFDEDRGENTGGMGAASPPLVCTKDIRKQTEEIFKKTFNGLKEEGRPYKGILFLGGIIVDNKVYIIEFNARWGDPEAQVIIPGIENDYFQLVSSVIGEDLKNTKLKINDKARVAVAGCSKGYPTDYANVKGKEILGLAEVIKSQDFIIYGAGIQIKDKKFFANGGRLFYVVGEGKDCIKAREKAYSAMKKISIDGDNLHYRTDIGWRDVKRLKRK